MFREIGLADELGSGMRNTNKYTMVYSGWTLTFNEGDIFKITIPLKNITTAKAGLDSKNVSHDVEKDKAHLQAIVCLIYKLKEKRESPKWNKLLWFPG